MLNSKKFHEFIYDETQIERFYSLLSPLKTHEAYFLSMSARNKYLTEEEREYYKLGRTEMFARKLCKHSDFIFFLRVLKSMQVSFGGYTSKNGKELPDKCLVVYVNINPVDGMKALKEFNEKTNQLMFDMVDNIEVKKKFASLDTELMNCYQRSKGTRKFIDIDFDLPEEGFDIFEQVIFDLKKYDIKYHVIKTHNGYHTLLEKETIHYNYTKIVNIADERAKERFGHAEIIINKNNMIPLSGTMQGVFPVHFLDV